MVFGFNGMAKRILAAALPLMFLCGTAQAFEGMGMKKERGFGAPAAPDVPGKEWKDDDCILKMGSEKLTYADMRKLWAEQRGARGELSDLPSGEQEAFFSRYGYISLFVEAAEKEGVEKTEEFKRAFHPDLYRELNSLYRKRVVEDPIKVSDDELIHFLPPALPEVQLRIIVKESAAEAAAIRKRVLAGEDFAKIAEEESEGRSAQHAGLSGFLNTGTTKMLPPPVVQKFLDAPIGYVSEPFYQDIGFLVAKVEAKRSAEEIRRAALERERAKILWENYYQPAWEKKKKELREKGKVKVFEDNIDKLARGEGKGEDPLLSVNGETYSGDQIVGDMAVDESNRRDAIEKNLRSFTVTVLIGQDAVKRGLHEDREFGSLYEELRREALYATYLNRIKRAVLAEGVTPEDVERYRKTHPEDVGEPAKRKISVIVIHDEKERDKVLDRLDKGEAFGEVARQMSRHAESAPKGGDLGFFEAANLPPVIAEAAFALGVGKYTKPPVYTETPDLKPQWIFIQVTDARKATEFSEERVKSPIVQQRILTLKRSAALTGKAAELSSKLGYDFCFQD